MRAESESGLEDQLQSKLHGTRAAHLVQRTQDSQAVRQRCGCLPERATRTWGTVIRVDRPEIGVVEDIEGLGAKLQLKPFVDAKLATSGKIDLPGSKSIDEISRR